MRRHRRDPGNQRFTQISLDVEFLGVAHATVAHDCRFARLEGGLAGEIFRGIGFCRASRAGVVEAGCPERHEIGGLKLHPTGCERMLDGLVMSDRPIEDDALLGIADRLDERRAPEPHRLRRDQDALRIHAV
jgi:hypothetical protein